MMEGRVYRCFHVLQIFNIREVEDGNGDDVGGGDDGNGDGVDNGGHQVDVVVLGQQAGHLGAALVYVDHLQIHHQL